MIERILPLYNEKYGDTLRYEDIKQYNMRPYLKPECEQLFEEFVDDQFIESMEMSPGAVEALTDLNKKHSIVFVTAGHPFTMRARDNWLGAHLPFYQSRSLIMCRNKQLLKLDYLVDDYEQNLIGGSYYGFLLDKPWNRDVPTRLYRMQRIVGMADLPKIIYEMQKGSPC